MAGGGGGYGDPHLRAVERVVEEVRYGTISIESARENYGVAVDPKTFEADEQETARLRGSSFKPSLDT